MSGNIYPVNQCTWWCWQECSWLEPFGNLGNALTWAQNYASKGGMLTTTPTVGSVVCFQPGEDGAGGYGHVAVVVAVEGSSFTVSESDVPFGAGPSTGRVCAMVPGIEFLLPPGGGTTPSGPIDPQGVDEMASDTPGWFWAAKDGGSQHIIQVSPDGTAWHKWFSKYTKNQWQNEQLALPENLVPGAGVSVWQTPGQYHWTGTGVSGRCVHGWQDDGGSTWGIVVMA